MRRWGFVLAAVSTLMLVAVALLRFAVVPAREKLPADTNQSVTYSGNVTSTDVGALMSGKPNAVVNVPVTVKRTVEVLQTSGDKARLSDTATMTSSTGQVPSSLARTQHFYAVDRKSLAAVANFTDKPVTQARGLVVSFPIGTEKKSYTGWVADVGATGKVTYQGKGTVKGVAVYRFAGTFSQPMPAAPAGAPTSVPKAQLVVLAQKLQLPAAIQQSLAAALPTLPDPVPLTYTFTQADTYAVEPDTGVIVDMTRKIDITAGVDQPVVPVLSVALQYTPSSVTSMADKARNDRDAMQLFGTTLPIGLSIAGLVGLALGVAMVAGGAGAPRGGRSATRTEEPNDAPIGSPGRGDRVPR
jgi:hypothetical protein